MGKHSRLAMMAMMAMMACIVGWPHTAAANCDDPFADPAQMLTFDLRMSRADWDTIRFDPTVGNGCDAQYPYVEIEFRCGSQDWMTIGARRKRGDQRGRDTDHKPPIKLDFNRFTAGQRWPTAKGNLGFRKLSLNNGQEDNPGGQLTALLSEYYAWVLMRKEVPRASGVAYARLNVHFTDDSAVQFHGLYILIEDIDRTAIRARFPSDEGTLLKTTTGSCRNQVVFDDAAPNSSTDAFDAWFALDSGDFPGTWPAQTNMSVELDELLRAEALRDVLANGADTVLGNNNSNFYSFDEKTGAKRHYLPWDLDDVFRPYPQNVPFSRSLESGCSALGDRTRCDGQIETRYLEIACQLTQGTLAEERLLADFATIDAVLRPIIAEEIPLVWTNDDPLDEMVTGTYANEYIRMRDWIANRIPHVRGQIEARGVTCSSMCNDGDTEACPYLHCTGERRCDQGRWTTCLVPPESDNPGNGADDDCDGLIDEGVVSPDAGVASGDGGTGVDDPNGDGGCCRSSEDGDAPLVLASLLLLALWPRRRSER